MVICTRYELDVWLLMQLLLHHSLWHSFCQCGHRNRSVPHWLHSPPQWRHDHRCEVERKLHCKDTKREVTARSSRVWLTKLYQTHKTLDSTEGQTAQWKNYLLYATLYFKPKTIYDGILSKIILYPLLNFLNGGRMTLRLFTTQCLPTLTLARSPLMIQSFITIV